ncbi:MAG: hypothetical protein J4415_02720 [Candidatus Diapherotrites archaeon]|uniref:30S ribosomal protein S17 n=1 Tax=Candidatus Iainarchaeum sp. TaxID=3101447 RepID=A0A8T4KWK8_9ARCH|nr:hypothetical protein [Candidatus Diapherotrites archaeon]
MAEHQKAEGIGNEGFLICKDLKCPVHGNVKVRGNMFEGIVIRAKAPKTIIMERYLMQYVRKYERYRKVRSHAVCEEIREIQESEVEDYRAQA